MEIINCKKAEFLNESDLLLSEKIKLNNGYIELDLIPHMTIGENTVYYLQQGMSLYVVKKDKKQKIMYIYVIEQTINNGKMAIKDIYTTTVVDNDIAEFYKYNKQFELKNIEIKLIELLESLPFVTDTEYMRTKITEYLDNNDQKIGITDNQKLNITFDKTKLEKKPKRNIAITCNGVTYDSISEFCRKNNLALATTSSKLKKGIPAEEILKGSNKTEKVMYEYNGKTYSTLKSVAKDANVRYEPLWERVKKGMSIDEAINSMLESKKYNRFATTKYTYAGQRLTLKELSELSGKPASTIYNRVNRAGWSVEEAIET